MTKPIPIANSAIERIQPTESTVRRIDPEEVAAALGGELCADRIKGRPGQITLFALRTEMANRRQSTDRGDRKRAGQTRGN